MPLPFIDVRAAVSVGRLAVPPGPELTPPEMAELVAGLRRAAEASVAPVAAVTHLDFPPEADLTAAVIDRATWTEVNATMASALLAEAAGGLPEPRTPGDRLSAAVNGAQLGAALALVGTRILGQYLPFGEHPRLILVAPNIAHAEAQLGVNRDDFRMWVCLHERTHHLQFAQAPWLRSHLVGKVEQLLADEDAGPAAEGRRRPASMVDLLTTPGQQAVLDEVGAIMALLEGYADDMMDRVGPDVVPSVAMIRERFEQRRRRGGVRKIVNKAMGMDLKLAQYADGAAFCREVIGRVGVDGLNAAYESPGLLPRPDEIREPARWVARVHG